MTQQWRLLLAAIVSISLVACDDGETTPPDRTGAASTAVTGGATAGESTVPPATALVVDEAAAPAYDWASAQIGAGGFVTGLAFGGPPVSPTLYARTDVGGAYRWDPATQRWQQLILASAMQGEEPLRAGDYTVLSVASSPADAQILYVAVGDDFDPEPGDDELSRTGRVLRSVDGGTTWAPSDQPFFVSGNQVFRTGTERVAVHPSDPTHVMFGTQREGLWRSTDGGASWSPLDVGPVTSGESDLREGERAGVNLVTYATAPDGSVLLVVGVADEGVFVSSDDGGSWTELLALTDNEVPASATQSGTTMAFAVHTPGSPSSRIFRVDLTAPTAVQQIVAPAESTGWNLAIDPFDPLHIVLAADAVRDQRLWTSRDGGVTWTAHDVAIESPEIPWLERTDLETFMSLGRLVFDPALPGRLWFGEGMGVWRTDDLDAAVVTFRSSAVGIEETVVSGIAVLPDGRAIVTVADRQGFRIVEGSFPDRTLIDERFASGSMVAFSAGHPEVVAWVGAESNVASSPDRAERGAVSADGGLTFTEMGGLVDDMYGGEVAVSTTDPSTIVWLPSDPIDPLAFESEPAGLFVSGDGGSTWTNVSVDGADDSFHRLFWWFSRRALAADTTTGAFYLMSDAERFFVSEDGALTWEEAAHSPPCTLEVDCHVTGQVRGVPGRAGHLVASVGLGDLYRTTDAGASPWRPLGGFSEVVGFDFGASMEPGGSPTLFVWGVRTGDEALALWRSDDDGGTWEFLTRYPNDMAASVRAVAGDPVTPGRVYIGFAGAGAVVGTPAR